MGVEEARVDPDCAGGALLDWCTWLDFRPWKTKKKCSLIFQNKTVRDFSWLVLSCEEPLLEPGFIELYHWMLFPQHQERLISLQS